MREPQEVQRGDRTRSRFRAVVIFLHPQEDARVFAAAAEVTPAFFIEEQPVLRFLQLDRELKPVHLEGGFIEIEQTLNNKRVVVRESLHLAAAFAIVSH